MTLIAIITPAYNAEKYLAATIDSVLAQSFPAWELIVVNDGSTDGTAQIVDDYSKRDSRIRMICQPNGGLAAARNRGLSEIAAARAFVTFLDADDTWEPEALTLLIDKLDSQPEAIAAHGTCRYMDSSGNLTRIGEHEAFNRERYAIVGKKLVPVPLDQPTTFAILLYRNVVPVSGIVVRHAAIRIVGGFDSTCNPMEDWDMWLRLSQQGTILFVNAVIYNYRRHDSNMSSNNDRMLRAFLRIRQKLLFASELTLQQRQLVVWSWRQAIRDSGRTRLKWTQQALKEKKLIMCFEHLLHSLRIYLYSFSPVEKLIQIQLSKKV